MKERFHINAQRSILGDFLHNRSLAPHQGLSPEENRFRSEIIRYSQQAYAELTDIVGLDKQKLKPMTDGQTVTLDGEQRDILLGHIFSIIGLKDIHTAASQKPTNLQELQNTIEAKDIVDTVKHGLSVDITGPLISFKFSSTKSMRLFNTAFTEGTSVGFFTKFPLQRNTTTGSIDQSQVTFVNFLDLEAEKDAGQDVTKHERWHAVDCFRQMVYRNTRQHDALAIEDDTDPYYFLNQLDEYLYFPGYLGEELRSLQRRIPELYEYYLGKMEDDNTVFQLTAAQNELSAHIAGHLKDHTPTGITEEESRQIALAILKGYLPFGQIEEADLLLRATTTPQGRWVVTMNDRELENDINPRVISLQAPPQTWKNILDRYAPEDQTNFFKRRSFSEQSKDEYQRDMQLLLDFFYNPGGYGYELMEKIKRNLYQSVESFRTLAILRGDPEKALLELSLLPISKWGQYTEAAKRSMKKQ